MIWIAQPQKRNGGVTFNYSDIISILLSFKKLQN
jgi:hypothetical protein